MNDRLDLITKDKESALPVIAVSTKDGILFVAINSSISLEDPDTYLHKLSEIHDNIGLGACGNPSEYDPLRRQFIDVVDRLVYDLSKDDIVLKSLANSLAGELRDVYRNLRVIPYVVYFLLAECQDDPKRDHFVRISLDGKFKIFNNFTVIGGHNKEVGVLMDILKLVNFLEMDWPTALTAIKEVMKKTNIIRIAGAKKSDKTVEPFPSLEVAILWRGKIGRKWQLLPHQIKEVK